MKGVIAVSFLKPLFYFPDLKERQETIILSWTSAFQGTFCHPEKLHLLQTSCLGKKHQSSVPQMTDLKQWLHLK